MTCLNSFLRLFFIYKSLIWGNNIYSIPYSFYLIMDLFDTSLFLTPSIACAAVLANGFPQVISQVSFDARLHNGRRHKI